MKKFFKYVLLLLGLDVLLFLMLALKPVPDPLSKTECLRVTGIVASISEAGNTEGYLVISLTKDDRQYVIDRLLNAEQESFKKLVPELEGKEVTLYYPTYSTPLDYADKLCRLSMVELNGQEIWGELPK